MSDTNGFVWNPEQKEAELEFRMCTGIEEFRTQHRKQSLQQQHKGEIGHSELRAPWERCKEMCPWH